MAEPPGSGNYEALRLACRATSLPVADFGLLHRTRLFMNFLYLPWGTDPKSELYSVSISESGTSFLVTAFNSLRTASAENPARSKLP